MANRRVALIAAGVAAGAYFFFPGSLPKSNVFETDGVKNVANAFSSGGGTTTHTPGIATRRGDHTDNVSPQEKQKGIGTPYFDEHHASQKVGEPGAVEKAFRGAHYGNEKGK